jgi:hypothetical protein
VPIPIEYVDKPAVDKKKKKGADKVKKWRLQHAVTETLKTVIERLWPFIKDQSDTFKTFIVDLIDSKSEPQKTGQELPQADLKVPLYSQPLSGFSLLILC